MEPGISYEEGLPDIRLVFPLHEVTSALIFSEASDVINPAGLDAFLYVTERVQQNDQNKFVEIEVPDGDNCITDGESKVTSFTAKSFAAQLEAHLNRLYTSRPKYPIRISTKNGIGFMQYRVANTDEFDTSNGGIPARLENLVFQPLEDQSH
jgi:hypothetical protein